MFTRILTRRVSKDWTYEENHNRQDEDFSLAVRGENQVIACGIFCRSEFTRVPIEESAPGECDVFRTFFS